MFQDLGKHTLMFKRNVTFSSSHTSIIFSVPTGLGIPKISQIRWGGKNDLLIKVLILGLILRKMAGFQKLNVVFYIKTAD